MSKLPVLRLGPTERTPHEPRFPVAAQPLSASAFPTTSGSCSCSGGDNNPSKPTPLAQSAAAAALEPRPLMARSTGAAAALQRSKGGLLSHSAVFAPKSVSAPAIRASPTPRRRNEREKGLKELPAEFATEIERAIAVDVAYNRFCALPPVLLSAASLEELDLTGNALTTLPDAFARALPSLVSLRLSLNPLGPRLPPCVFLLPALRELIARRCGISEIAVPAQAAAPLRLLDLDENDLTALPGDIGKLTSLRVLALSGNRIESLPRALGLLQIAELRARRNQIRALVPLPCAQFVDLSFNGVLDSLPPSWFDPERPHVVRTLLLQGNAFETVPDGIFRQLPLETLDLSFNKLRQLPPVTGPASLQGLFLGNNLLQEIVLAPAEALPHLQSLDLSHNCLSALPDFSGFASLRLLNAGYNILTADVHPFPSGLRELHLSGCKLSELPDCKLPALEFVFIAQNKLRHRTSLKLLQDATTSLRFLDVSFNQLKQLPSRIAHAKAVGVEVQTDESTVSSAAPEDSPSPSQLQPPSPHPVPAIATAKSSAGHTFANKLRAGVSLMTGRRSAMEDVVRIKGCLLGDPRAQCPAADLFSLLDGHGSDLIAKTAAATIERLLKGCLAADTADPCKCLREVLKQAALEAKKLSIERIQGATALVALFLRQPPEPSTDDTVADDGKLMLHIANIGDTRAILHKGGRTTRLSVDHKPLLPDEYKRILNAGGFVTVEGRVSDTLAIARALGDVQLHPYVSSEPSITSIEITQDTEFIAMASDGVWDVLTDEIAGKIVSNVLSSHHGSASIAAKTLRDCAFSAGSADNISVIVIDCAKHRSSSTSHHRHHRHSHKQVTTTPTPDSM